MGAMTPEMSATLKAEREAERTELRRLANAACGCRCGGQFIPIDQGKPGDAENIIAFMLACRPRVVIGMCREIDRLNALVKGMADQSEILSNVAERRDTQEAKS